MLNFYEVVVKKALQFISQPMQVVQIFSTGVKGDDFLKFEVVAHSSLEFKIDLKVDAFISEALKVTLLFLMELL